MPKVGHIHHAAVFFSAVAVAPLDVVYGADDDDDGNRDFLTCQLLLCNELANRLANLPVADEDASVENRWCQLRDKVQSSALDVLGCTRRKHQDGFDEKNAAIHTLLTEKNRLHKAYVDRPTAENKTAYYRSRRLVQQRLREIQDAWMARKAQEIQGHADHNEMKNFL
ncbi:unnamed protein product [Schistocephalus solidus]|uniref:Secreted protein n=1 Tax=Schistocephalus solidus TaxID=70667 RepID=A0A183TDZ8_SCHSO|nr:unnamed protein product [Schistocephalus solidus]